jgi:hypothetical protein
MAIVTSKTGCEIISQAEPKTIALNQYADCRGNGKSSGIFEPLENK